MNVDPAIARFGLSKCADTRFGSASGGARDVSGGERRRTSLANEMLATPDLFMADEPTSGLDSTTAYAVMRVLKNYAAEGGRSVVATVHQPSIAIGRLFDRVLLMSEGEVVWTGKTADMEPWFSACGYPFPDGYNPWDYVMQLLIDGEVEVVIDDWIPVNGSTESPTPIEKNTSADAVENPRDRLVRLWKERELECERERECEREYACKQAEPFAASEGADGSMKEKDRTEGELLMKAGRGPLEGMRRASPSSYRRARRQLSPSASARHWDCLRIAI